MFWAYMTQKVQIETNPSYIIELPGLKINEKIIQHPNSRIKSPTKGRENSVSLRLQCQKTLGQCLQCSNVNTQPVLYLDTKEDI